MSEENKDNVVELKVKEAAKPQGVSPEVTADPRSTMTPEEIQEYMRREEEALYGKVDKFLALNPKPDTSSLTEEDEEEEVFTLDLENKVVTQKVGEGVLARDKDGNIHEVKDPNIIEMVEEKVKEVAQPAKPILQVKYADAITERFVSRAIASLLAKLRDASFKAEETLEHSLKGTFLAGELASKAVAEIDNKRDELKKAYSNYPRLGSVAYDRIPEWATSYIDEYVERCINNLIDLGEQE